MKMQDFKEVVRSPSFVFQVGEKGIPITVHQDAVKSLSEPLSALMENGHMRESISGVAVLGDVEVDTFVGFCEYAYTGSYGTPECKNLDKHISPQKSPAFSDPPNPRPPPPISSMGPVYYRLMCQQFRRLKFDADPVPETSKPDLVFHAKLYVFATKYLIYPLREICLASLHRDLCSSHTPMYRISQVFELLDFTYAHTGCDEPDGASPLRSLLIYYVASLSPGLSTDDRFDQAIESNAKIGADLVRRYLKTLAELSVRDV